MEEDRMMNEIDQVKAKKATLDAEIEAARKKLKEKKELEKQLQKERAEVEAKEAELERLKEELGSDE